MSVSITKIQLRRGKAGDLPGAPVSLTPLTFGTGLDEGELGYATDSGRLFIGVGTGVPGNGMPNFQRSNFPYQNVEVLTENSPPNVVFGSAFSDNQLGYIISTPLNPSGSFQNLQVTNPSTGNAQDFYLDIPGAGTNASISYFMYDTSHNPIRQGRISVLWNTNMVTTPLCTDEAQVAIGSYTSIQWQAALVGSSGNQHVVLQYINATSDTPSVLFRVDRPGYTSTINSNALNAPVNTYLTYSQLPSELTNAPVQMYLAGRSSSSSTGLILPIAMSTIVPANFAGSTGYAGVISTGTATFTVSYIRSGITTAIGTIVFTSASAVPTFSTQAAVNLVANDVVTITVSTADATLANVAITLLLQKV